MPLKVVQRAPGGNCYLHGTIKGRRIREAAGTADRAIAEEIRAKRESELFKEAIYGRASAAVPFQRAALSYLEFEPRAKHTRDYVGHLTRHFGDAPLTDIDQAGADRAAQKILGPKVGPATRVRNVYVPLAAILNHAATRGWCPPPRFQKPRTPKGRTRWLTPDEATALVEASAPHIRPLLLFILGCGARMSEALDLTWDKVDLQAGRVRLDVKGGGERVAALPPAVVIALAGLPLPKGDTVRQGVVFRRDDGKPYADKNREGGGQIKTAFRGALRRAGITTPTSPHDLRHTWATWFYSLSKDLLLLKAEGGWSALTMVERYAHLMPSEHAPGIARVWCGEHPRIGTKLTQGQTAVAER